MFSNAEALGIKTCKQLSFVYVHMYTCYIYKIYYIYIYIYIMCKCNHKINIPSRFSQEWFYGNYCT